MDARHALPIDRAARLLGVHPSDLAVGCGGTATVDADTMDLLTNQPPTWLMEARARRLVDDVFTSVGDDLLAKAIARTASVASAVASATLSTDEVADLLGLPTEVVAPFEPRRGWTADVVADLLRSQPAWLQSADEARDAARKATWRARRAEDRRTYAEAAKLRGKERNRARWAEVAGVSLDEVPSSFTKAPTPDAIARFWKRPPSWAPLTPPPTA